VFERFTDAAREAVVGAQTEARALDHNYIGTEHLLLGVLGQGDARVSRALVSKGLSLEAARRRVEATVGRGRGPSARYIPFTPRAKKILELSLRESLQLGHDFIGIEHIALGIFREGEGLACKVLSEAGIDPAVLRNQMTAALLSGPPTTTPTPGAPSWRPVLTTTGSPTIALGAPQTTCALCMRSTWELGHYVRGAGTLICDDCIERSHQVLHGATAQEVLLAPLVEEGASRETAAQEIAAAFRLVYTGDAQSDREAALEDGPALLPLGEKAAERYPGVAATFALHRIRFRSDADADVFFSLAGLAFSGRARFLDGHWKVSRDTWCQTLSGAGVECPPGKP
jgi:Clp amino terminal domain, pathogenicity island component/ClpX C4-type zinc finger